LLTIQKLVVRTPSFVFLLQRLVTLPHPAPYFLLHGGIIYIRSCTMPSHQPAAGMMAVDPDFVSQPSPMAKKSEPNRNKSYDPKK
jgi:hypothetical protein